MDLELVLRDDEKAIFALRELYESYGYTQYKMSKFEEYDLYAINKEFLVSDNVITFTDTDGKLMALKPDVTLSIIKNGVDNGYGVQKVFYNENVYRVSKGTKSFKEIMQAGLECFGAVDDYAKAEVIMLALKSLQSICKEYVLDISNLDLVNAVFEKANLSSGARKQALTYLSQKNLNGIISVCESQCVSENDTELLKALVSTYGNVDKVSQALNQFKMDKKTTDALGKLVGTVKLLEKAGFSDKINVDFSVVSDLNYYNGLIFKGFISGVPTSILSGGQYDNLMQKLNKKSRAIGFAVYLDELSKIATNQTFEVDVAIEYGEKQKEQVFEMVDSLIKQGKKVFADKKIATNVRYNELIKL